MSSLPTVLVVDDDSRLRDLIEKFLSQEKFNVQVASCAAEAENLLKQTKFEAMVLDVMMPEETGFAFLKRLQKEPHVSVPPTLFLTARDEGEDRIRGLELGASDYLSKPFEPRELVLRLNNILKIYSKATFQRESDSVKSFIPLGRHTFDPDRGDLINRETQEVLPLTTVEINLLRCLCAVPGVPLSREVLAEKAGVTLSPRTVDVQVARLRRKIEPNPREPLYLKTIRHQGYVLLPQ